MDQFDCPFTSAIEVPPGSRQTDATTMAQDSNMVSTTFKITSANEIVDVYTAIQYILGTATTVGNPVSGFNLSRTVPARHPVYKWLRATRITSIQGRGGPADKFGRAIANNCSYGPWTQVWMTVQFEQPTFLMLNDSTVLDESEYARWCVRTFKPNLETLARKGVAWSYVNLPGVSNLHPRQYPGDVYLRQPKGILEIKWYDVPDTFTHLGAGGIGGLIPTNIMRAVGTLNSRAFPQTFIPRDQNQQPNVVSVQFAPGTLLMLEPDCVPRTRLDPQLFAAGFNNPIFFPRSFDWVLRWLVFEPLTDPINYIQVNPLYDPSVTITVQGHNLLPTVYPSTTGYSWYPAVSNQNAIAALAAGGLLTFGGAAGGDRYLQYLYFNHELVFSSAQSLNAAGGLFPLP